MTALPARPLRILITGSRRWTDRTAIRDALINTLATYTTLGSPVLIHGGAQGADAIADSIWHSWRHRHNIRLAPAEVHQIDDHAGPKQRNQHMVDLGATVCLAFALAWASGTGHCARAARRAGITTIDYGVDTRIEAKRGPVVIHEGSEA